jgi:hypothetical protein
MNAIGGRFVLELDRAKKIAVVGHCNGRHSLSLGDAHQLLDVTSAVEQRVVRVAMEVNEGPLGHVDYFSLTAVRPRAGPPCMSLKIRNCGFESSKKYQTILLKNNRILMAL